MSDLTCSAPIIQIQQSSIDELRAENERLNHQIGEMALLIRGLVHRLGQDIPLSKRAIGYLVRKGLQGSPLRNS